MEHHRALAIAWLKFNGRRATDKQIAYMMKVPAAMLARCLSQRVAS